MYPRKACAASRLHQLGEAAPIDAAASLHRRHPDGRGKVAFPSAGRAKEVQDLGPLDELKLRKGHDAMSIQRGQEGEVEACDLLVIGVLIRSARALEQRERASRLPGFPEGGAILPVAFRTGAAEVSDPVI
jgi:hypothetical protein